MSLFDTDDKLGKLKTLDPTSDLTSWQNNNAGGPKKVQIYSNQKTINNFNTATPAARLSIFKSNEKLKNNI